MNIGRLTSFPSRCGFFRSNWLPGLVALFGVSWQPCWNSLCSSIWIGRSRMLNDLVYHQSFKCKWIGKSQKYLLHHFHSKRVLGSIIHRLLQRMKPAIILLAMVIVRRLVYLVLLEVVVVGVSVIPGRWFRPSETTIERLKSCRKRAPFLTVFHRFRAVIRHSRLRNVLYRAGKRRRFMPFPSNNGESYWHRIFAVFIRLRLYLAAFKLSKIK